jgi:hypothetical protein
MRGREQYKFRSSCPETVGLHLGEWSSAYLTVARDGSDCLTVRPHTLGSAKQLGLEPFSVPVAAPFHVYAQSRDHCFSLLILHSCFQAESDTVAVNRFRNEAGLNNLPCCVDRNARPALRS